MATGTGSRHFQTNLTNHGSGQRLLPNLPPEIIAEILSRLPIKSLVRFRCVSKPWRSLISDPHFVKKHLRMSTTTNHSFETHRLIFSCIEPKMCFKSCSVYALFNEPKVDAVDFKYPLSRRLRSDSLIGACNGLICVLSGRGTLHLWNPSTKETRNLPNFEFLWLGRRISPSNYSAVYGFGYDSSIDDHKVVSISYRHGTRGFNAGTEVKVFTLRTGAWRRIGEFPYGKPCYESGKFVSGALNWPVEYDSNAGVGHPNPQWKIVALDLASEGYQEVPQPMYHGDVCYQKLGVLGGKLSITCQNRCAHADVWVMKEYGDRESWNNMFRIPYLTNADVVSIGFPYSPLCYAKNNELLLEFMEGFLLYNINDDTIRHLDILNFDACKDVYVYVESLVSPNPEDGIARDH